MAINTGFILAAISAAGTSGAELAWFAPTGSTAPTNATSGLDAAFLSAGLVSEDGVTKAVKDSSTDIKAYGISTPVRKIVTSEEITFQATFLETNKVSTAVYNRLSLSAITPVSGAFTITEGVFRTQRYAVVFDMVDGSNHIRAYAPLVEVTDKGDQVIKNGTVVSQQVTLTAYPGSDGVSVSTFYVVSGLT